MISIVKVFFKLEFEKYVLNTLRKFSNFIPSNILNDNTKRNIPRNKFELRTKEL